MKEHYVCAGCILSLSLSSLSLAVIVLSTVLETLLICDLEVKN